MYFCISSCLTKSKTEEKRVDRNSQEKLGQPTFRIVILAISNG